MIQLIATVFCFFAAGFWFFRATRSEAYVELFFSLYCAFAFSGLFLMGAIVLAT